jgi:hypothetical protein
MVQPAVSPETALTALVADHERRKRFIGGSDVAGILALSPWQTPLSVWLSKTGQVPPRMDPVAAEQRRKFFARRKRQEPVVAEMLADTYGIVVTRLSLDDNPNRYIDSDVGFLAAEIDFEFEMSDASRLYLSDRTESFAAIPNGTLLNGEIKTVHPFKAGEWGEEGSEEIPVHYAAQAMHGLGVAPGKRPACVVAALFGLDTLSCFCVMRDDETIRDMRKKLVHFWTTYVIPGTPPPAINTDDIKTLFQLSPGIPTELDDAHRDVLADIIQKRHEVRSMEEWINGQEFRLAKYITDQWGDQLIEIRKGDGRTTYDALKPDDARLLYGGQEIGSWKRQRGTYLDQKLIREEHPEITAAYTVEHHFRVLRMKQPKKG